MTNFPAPQLPVPESTGSAAAERLAALRNKPAGKRRKPAHTSKIFAAGLSTTALFGMITAMGWPAATPSAQSAAPAAPVVPTTTVPTPPARPATRSTDDEAPTALTPTTTAAIVVPTATPVVQAPVHSAPVRAASNTVTNTSG